MGPEADGMLATLALLPNVVCKPSGRVTEDGTGWIADEIEPSIAPLLACFGAQRLLFGSDRPVCTLVASDAGVLELARAALAPCLSGEEPDAVFCANATAQYRLTVRAA